MPQSQTSAYRAKLRVIPRCEHLEDRITPTVSVRFDYTYDTTGFFNSPERRAALDSVAADITANMGDSLAAIAPSGGNTWTANTWNSATNSQLDVANPTVGADQIVIYITAGNLGGALGIASGGAYSSSGSQDWLNTVRTRGQAGVDGGTDFSTWGGLIAFNSGANFSFAGAPSGSQYDFKSVAAHEMMHVFGFGLENPSYLRHTSTGYFTGPNVVSTTGYPVKLQDGVADHFAPGTKFGGQESIMAPSVTAGQVKPFGPLEYAALRDIGWASKAPVPVPPAAVPPPPPAPVTPIASAISAALTPAPAPGGPATTKFVVGDGAGGVSVVTGYGAQGQTTYSGTPFENFTGGVRVALGDVTGDGVGDLVLAAGPGGGPRVIVIDGASGREVRSFFAFDTAFKSGIYIATADFDRDGHSDLVVGAGYGGGPHVKVFSGRDGALMASFFAFDTTYWGGIVVAAGDIDGDGTADLAVGAMGGHIATFDGDSIGRRGVAARLTDQFASYESTFTGGISLAIGDLDGDGFGEVIVGATAVSAPRVVAVDGRNIMNRRVAYAASFFAGDPNGLGGASVATTDFDGDGRADIVVGPGSPSDGKVRVYLAARGFGGPPTPWMTMQNDTWATRGSYVG